MENRSKTTEKVVGASELVSLYDAYRHDRTSKKFDYGKDRHDFEEGYSFFHQEALKGVKDEAFSNRNYFYLLNGVAASDIAHGGYVDPLELTVWVFLMAPNGKYLGTTKDPDGKTRVYADTERGQLDQRNVFRITKDELGHTISQGGAHMSVITSDNLYTIEMVETSSYDEFLVYHFEITRVRRQEALMINTIMKPHWRRRWPDSQPQTIRRFFSIYDQMAPEGSFEDRPCGYPYLYDGYAPNMLKCVGNAYWDGYNRFGDSGDINRISNNYIFRVDTDCNDIGEKAMAIGYDGKVRWVKYHNEIFDKSFNGNVEPKFVLDNLRPSALFESAYEAGIGHIKDESANITVAGKDLKIDIENEADFRNSFVELKSATPPLGNYTTDGTDQKAPEKVEENNI